MKKFVFHSISVLSLLLALVSCVGQDNEDPADRFVGTYFYDDVYYVTWGNDSGSLSDSGTLIITKMSPNTVKISNPWNTTATVMANRLNMAPVTQSDNSGYINYTFRSATIAGNLLSISYEGVGSLKYTNGKSYPYSCHGDVSARKKN